MLYFGNVYKFCSRLIFPAENSLAFFFGAAGGAFPKSRLLAAWYIYRRRTTQTPFSAVLPTEKNMNERHIVKSVNHVTPAYRCPARVFTQKARSRAGKSAHLSKIYLHFRHDLNRSNTGAVVLKCKKRDTNIFILIYRRFYNRIPTDSLPAVILQKTTAFIISPAPNFIFSQVFARKLAASGTPLKSSNKPNNCSPPLSYRKRRLLLQCRRPFNPIFRTFCRQVKRMCERKLHSILKSRLFPPAVE